MISVKGQRINILGFAGHAVHHNYSTLLLQPESSVDCVPTKHNLQTQVTGGLGLMD